MTYVLPFRSLRSKDSAIAGGKGASLGELTQAGAPVPPGFVILTAAFRRFAEPLDLELADVTTQNAGERAAALRKLIDGTPIPDAIQQEILTHFAGLTKVAVRSSATAEDSASTAWAGQLDSYLDVEQPDLLGKVRDCWASLYTERALLYRIENGLLGTAIDVAVVVQQMVDAQVAGVGFSVHPTTQEPDLMMLQAAYGLGEAVVSGAVNPDTWVISKSKDAITDQAVGDKKRMLVPGNPPHWEAQTRSGPCLTDDEAREYGRILRGIEAHYGHPVDTEWARADGKFYVVQARPITTLDPDYNHAFYDESIGYAASIRRPWNTLSGTMFARNVRVGLKRLGIPFFPLLLVEPCEGMIQVCLVPSETKRVTDAVGEMCRRDPATIEAILRRGLELERAPREANFKNLIEALDAFAEVVVCATQVPFFVMDGVPEGGPLVDLARELRSASLYPWYTDTVLPPLVLDRLKELGAEGLKFPLRVVTVYELIDGVDPAELHRRDELVARGQLSVFQLTDAPTLSFHPSTGFLLARLHHARVPLSGGDAKVLHGSSAYPGVVEGVAQVVLHPDDPFEAGRVLISVNANPSFMGAIAKCAAIVTDEGGASCHAAIVSRELKKPCVIGTGDATTRIQNGQKVRVDAFAQTVTLL